MRLECQLPSQLLLVINDQRIDAHFPQFSCCGESAGTTSDNECLHLACFKILIFRETIRDLQFRNPFARSNIHLRLNRDHATFYGYAVGNHEALGTLPVSTEDPLRRTVSSMMPEDAYPVGNKCRGGHLPFARIVGLPIKSKRNGRTIFNRQNWMRSKVEIRRWGHRENPRW